ncbi:oxygen-dependent coproporphyrinogen-III oxidase, chloroplastic-like [Impatiens glandulifera]|uniref:oxygen-dependent coproporphyrinogen-III oxidase, chloroplastic-like n=1 Tax=Impatiens glandulifera TaxID=253017 RepID=UPI001FB15573|nr:oxygen-dependent coproporphyrinogen-III oxidase, chloroplastic-like [Impatiens glandulifera]
MSAITFSLSAGPDIASRRFLHSSSSFQFNQATTTTAAAANRIQIPHLLLRTTRMLTTLASASADNKSKWRAQASSPSSTSSTVIEKETMVNERPDTFLRESDGRPLSDADPGSSVRARFEKMIRETQDSVCAAIEALDGTGKFKEDVWSRPGGGGGISRVLQDGAVFEKAGVNVSVVYGIMPPDAYRAAKPVTGDSSDHHKPGPIPFFAAGVSSVLHPKNPFAPTIHFNYRYFETDAPKDAPGAPRQWWFGGGTDLTPAYIFEEDVKHFHSVQKSACDKFDSSFYPRFKKWCDDYFYIKHRGERRGLGGIFFDDLNNYDQEMLLSFATECANSVIPAYIPIVEKRKDTAFTDQHKEWQQLRRGRYVEFNLVYDRGTTFGLKTGGRIESILVSLPLTCRWEYDHQPEEGSEEWKLLDACINPKEWL